MQEAKAANGFKPSNPIKRSLRLKSKGYTYARLLTERSWFLDSVKRFWGQLGGEGIVSKKVLSRLSLSTDDLWKELIKQGYLNREGKIRNEFAVLKDYSEMALGAQFDKKKKEIHHILQRTHERSSKNAWLMLLLIVLVLIGMTVFELTQKSAQQNPYFKLCCWLGLGVFAINVMASLHYSLVVDYQAQGRFLFPSLIPALIWLCGRPDFKNRKIKLARIIIFCIMYPVSIYCHIHLFLTKLT
jgi:hypothetical protein